LTGSAVIAAPRGGLVDAVDLILDLAVACQPARSEKQTLAEPGILRLPGVELHDHAYPRPGSVRQHGWRSLTTTEQTVAQLGAEGLSNPQIGDRLYVSRRTVQSHVGHVFSKLDIACRAQLAAEVTRHRADTRVARAGPAGST
jgi:DNA-binding NarL/FixJ family response regulator